MSMNKIQRALLAMKYASIGFLYLCCFSFSALSEAKQDVEVSLRVAISDLNNSQKNINDRANAAENIMIQLYSLSRSEIEELEIEHIRNLEIALGDDDELVRAYAARILGMFGKKAKSALPALQRALNKTKKSVGTGTFGPSVSDADEIEFAISEITKGE